VERRREVMGLSVARFAIRTRWRGPGGSGHARSVTLIACAARAFEDGLVGYFADMAARS
jgi:hypothetical protein